MRMNPKRRPLGLVLRELRTEAGVNQDVLGEAIGLRTPQSQMSLRERDSTTDPRAVVPSADEIYAAEEYLGLTHGTVARRAGYVVDPVDPLEQIDGWAYFMSDELRASIKRQVEWAWERSGRPPMQPSSPAPRH